jgi:hypothetical protein
MTLENFNHLAGGIASLATIVALAVGGYWTYTRFIKQRENYAFIEFTVDINFVGKQGPWWIVELIANLENKGKVQHQFEDLSFDLEALLTTDAVSSSEKFGGQAFFPHVLARGPWVREGAYFIEPGIRAKYSYVARVPQNASFVMLHGKFTYLNQGANHSAERTVPVPQAEST